MDRLKQILMKLLYPHKACIILLCVCASSALSWVFLTGREESWIAYFIYVLSFYSLTVACIWIIPAIIRFVKMKKHKTGEVTPERKIKKFHQSLYIGIGINLVYAALNLVSGIVYRSVWMGSNGLYFFINTLIHIVMFRYERKLEALEDRGKKHRLGWTCFQVCGILLFILHLTMTGMVFQMVWQGQAESYPEYLIFGVAAYTFYKLIRAIIKVLQYRKNDNPILGAFRNIDLSEAMMSLFSLQTGLFAAFGKDFAYQLLMNILTGGSVCFLAMLGALGMIFHGNRKKKEILGEGYYG